MNAIADVMAISDVSRDAAGAIVLWRLSGETNFDALRAAFVAQGMDEKLLPDLPSPEVALRRAMQDQVDKRVLMRALPGKGYALVSEHSAEDDASAPLQYQVILQVRLVKSDVHPDGCYLDMSHSGATSLVSDQIHAAFRANMRRLEAYDTAEWLCQMVKHVQAVPLRDTGGVYFIPRQTLPIWRKVVASLRAASATFIAEIPALQSSEAVDAILDSLRREADQFSGSMEAELAAAAQTADGMGTRAIKTRVGRCEDATEKLGVYERLLGVKLEEVRTRLEQLQANLAAAALIAMAREEAP
jgi:hypothetical protein